MKEPKVQVGILFEPQIEFVLLNPYRMDGTEVSGKQVVTYDEGCQECCLLIHRLTVLQKPTLMMRTLAALEMT